MSEAGRRRVRRAKDALSIHSLSKELDRDKQRVGMKRFHSQSSPSHHSQYTPCKLYLRSHSQQKPKGIMALELYMSKELNKEQETKSQQPHLGKLNPSFKMLERYREKEKKHMGTEIGEGIKISRTLEVRRNTKHSEGKVEIPVGIKPDLKKKKWSTEIGCHYAPLHSYIEQLIRNNTHLQEEASTPKEEKIITVKAMQVEEKTWAQRKRHNNLQKLTEARKKKSFELSSLLDNVKRPTTKDYKARQHISQELSVGYGVSPWGLKETIGESFFPK